ncbi:hypothetical protein CBM2589_U10199 [Cupriavidus taiwanensis]|uniref:Uncharacterized protein n=1 Tax=Cupriavidus taiwanensis TaxID=164546 RepID=A0A375CR16_9BURK|nr:hypothetical protein CBM2589_U10199 [Cupriavidus taiwanensis]
MFSRFNARKETAEARLKTLANDRHRRLSRAIRVGAVSAGRS